MELLTNEMLKAGAARSRMKAHLYGGANMHAGMQEVGSANARFAVDFLVRDKIPLTFSNLGGNSARRVEFRAVKGQARCRVLADQIPSEIRLIPRSEEHTSELQSLMRRSYAVFSLHKNRQLLL